jgi:hypothetical protein
MVFTAINMRDDGAIRADALPLWEVREGTATRGLSLANPHRNQLPIRCQ